MRELSGLQQRVFCVYLRPRTINSNNTMSELNADELRFRDSTVDVCNISGTENRINAQYKPVRNLYDMTDPAGTKLLQYYKDCLSFPNDVDDELVFDTSRGTLPFNEPYYFVGDLWYLHSTWISFDKAKEMARKLIDAFGYDNVMLNAFVPLDLDLLPNK